MKLDTKTYLVGKNINTLGSSDIPQNALDITEGDSQLYHIIPSCAYIISNGIATPQEISFFLFKKENNSIQDITNRTKFVINYTINGVNGTFNLKSNKFAETDFDYSFSDITSLIVKAYDGDIEAAEFNIACVEQKSGGSSGTTGEKGEDGITFYVLPSIVTLQSDENGIVQDSQLIDKTVQIIAYRGSEKLDNVKIEPNGFELQYAEVEMVDGSTDTFRFKHIAQHDIEIPQEDESASTKKTISYTSGYAVVKFVADKTLCKTTVPFVVDNTVLYTSYYERTDKQLTSQYAVYKEINGNIEKYNTQIQLDAESLQATAKAVQQNGEEIKTDYNNWKTTANGTTHEIQSNVKSLQDGAIKVQDRVATLESTADGFEQTVNLVNTYIGQDGSKQQEKMGSYFKDHANEIVAGVFSDGTGTDAKESVMTLTDNHFGINLLKNGLNVAGFELADDGGNGEGTGSKFKVNADNITFEGTNAIQLISKEVSASGNLSAASIQTKTYKENSTTELDSSAPVIKLEKGLLTGYNSLERLNGENEPNLRFGIDEKSKTLQFEYRRDDGTLVWTLGASGLVQYITSGQLQRKKGFYVFTPVIGSLSENGTIKNTDISSDAQNFLYLPDTGDAVSGNSITTSGIVSYYKTCFQYVAPTIQGQIVEDTQYKLSKELAQKYNYYWFYSCSEDYKESNLYEWDLSQNNVNLGTGKQSEWKCMILGSEGIGGSSLIVDENVKWTDSVEKIINGQYCIQIGLDPNGDYGNAKEFPTSQDDYLSKDLSVIYYSSKVSPYIKS